jgi:hypothetical protein
MHDLQNTVEGYLESAGYSILDSREGFLVADKAVIGGDRDTRLFWIPPLKARVADFRVIEQRLLKDFEVLIPQNPDAKYCIVAQTLEGFSRDFRSEAVKYRVKMLVPIWFFDTPFRIEENPSATSPITKLRDPGLPHERVSQPFCVLINDQPQEHGTDLLPVLYDELRQPLGSCLRIIVGAAGAGKTVLFKTLFSRLYQHFLEKKRKQEVFPRPIPLIPEYLRQASALRVEELFDSFIRTDVAASLQPSTFDWMLVNGYSMWLFDGLDELYAGDPDFFDRFLDLVTWPGSKAKILICVRNSLLKTSDTFNRFLNEFGIEDPIRVYQLKDWDTASKRTFAWISLEKRVPRKEENDTPQVTQFRSIISKSDSLNKLSSLPYYCDLLLDQFKQATLREFTDDFGLIEYAIKGIIKREMDKKLLSLEQLESDGLNEWLETVASELYVKDHVISPPSESP